MTIAAEPKSQPKQPQTPAAEQPSLWSSVGSTLRALAEKLKPAAPEPYPHTEVLTQAQLTAGRDVLVGRIGALEQEGYKAVWITDKLDARTGSSSVAICFNHAQNPQFVLRANTSYDASVGAEDGPANKANYPERTKVYDALRALSKQGRIPPGQLYNVEEYDGPTYS